MTRRRLRAAIAAAIALCWAPIGWAQQPRLEPLADYPAKLVRVVDCDTLIVAMGTETVRLRLVGVDCFESRPNDRSLRQASELGRSQEEIVELGRISKRFVEAELRGLRNVTVRTHAKVFDRYGRVLGSVLFPDGRDLAEIILRAGFGVPLEIEPYTEKRATYGKAYLEAKAAGRGLWRQAAVADEPGTSSSMRRSQ